MGAVREGSDADLLGHLAGFVNRAITPDQFWSWLIHAETAIEMSGSDDGIDLARRIENRFYEWRDSDASADALRAVLREDAAEHGFGLPAEAALAGSVAGQRAG